MAQAQTPEHYDCLVIGSGEAGKLVPWILSGKHGQRCAVIERRWIGGSCPNIACLPSKTLLHSAAVAHDARAQGYAPASHKADMKAVRQRTADLVARVNGFRGAFEAYGVELIEGDAKFDGPRLVRVTAPDGGSRLFTADTIVICTGSRAFVDERIPGLVEAKPLTHIEALDLDTLPDHLIVLGGGYVGLEFAQAFRRFGAEVTVVQRRAQILPEEDSDLVEILAQSLTREGVRILTNTEVASVSGVNGKTVTVSLKSTDASAPAELRGSHILVAAGRVPNTGDLNAAAAGVELQSSGHIVVDTQLQTTAPGIYAAGDCAGSPHFTHMGWDDHRVIVGAVTGSEREGGTTGRLVPRALFTSPELARVGLGEREAQAKGIKYRLAKAGAADAFLRANTLGDEVAGTVLAKLLVEEESDKILGFVAVGPGVSELLPVVTLAMKLGASYREIENLIITHPTMNEGLVALAQQVPPRV